MPGPVHPKYADHGPVRSGPAQNSYHRVFIEKYILFIKQLVKIEFFLTRVANFENFTLSWASWAETPENFAELAELGYLKNFAELALNQSVW